VCHENVSRDTFWWNTLTLAIAIALKVFESHPRAVRAPRLLPHSRSFAVPE
jgi:hypothetical protein